MKGLALTGASLREAEGGFFPPFQFLQSEALFQEESSGVSLPSVPRTKLPVLTFTHPAFLLNVHIAVAVVLSPTSPGGARSNRGGLGFKSSQISRKGKGDEGENQSGLVFSPVLGQRKRSNLLCEAFTLG